MEDPMADEDFPMRPENRETISPEAAFEIGWSACIRALAVRHNGEAQALETELRWFKKWLSSPQPPYEEAPVITLPPIGKFPGRRAPSPEYRDAYRDPPEIGVLVEGCWIRHRSETSPPIYEFARVELYKPAPKEGEEGFGAGGHWNNERGHQIVFNPCFWRPLHGG
jgi:hypothetical protein